MDAGLQIALTAGCAALATGLTTYLVQVRVETAKRLLEVRAKAYDELLGTLTEQPQDTGKVLAALTRCTVFGSREVVIAIRNIGRGEKMTMEQLGELVLAMRDTLAYESSDRLTPNVLAEALTGIRKT